MLWYWVVLDRPVLSINQTMCDSGFFIIGFISMVFLFGAFMLVFYDFEYNCNNYYYDNIVSRNILELILVVEDSHFFKTIFVSGQLKMYNQNKS